MRPQEIATTTSPPKIGQGGMGEVYAPMRSTSCANNRKLLDCHLTAEFGAVRGTPPHPALADFGGMMVVGNLLWTHWLPAFKSYHLIKGSERFHQTRNSAMLPKCRHAPSITSLSIDKT